MKVTTLQAAFGSVALLLSFQPAVATHGHSHSRVHALYRKHHHQHMHAHELIDAPKSSEKVEKRGTCTLPDHDDLHYVPGAMNAGFAMSPDQECAHGSYCPIACKPGKVMAQWKPNTKYVYPESMAGGLYCDNGEPKKPFTDRPYCVDATGPLNAINKCGDIVSFCQTVLPGNEAMLIPTDVTDTAALAVPGPSYWANTSAHYYINPPGVGSDIGCVWGDVSKPHGNWSPYVAGANTDNDGNTFVKIAWNPIYTDCDWVKVKPSYGVKIECPGGGCNGLPCSIDPSTDGINGVTSPVAADGVGGASFCVVTVPEGGSANIVVFNTDGSSGSDGGSSKSSSSSPSPTPTPTPTPTPSSSSTPPPSPTSETSESSTSSSTSEVSSSSSVSSYSPVPSSSQIKPTVLPGIFHENNSTQSSSSVQADSDTAPAITAAPTRSSTDSSEAAPVPSTSTNEGGAADQGSAAIAGLIVAFVAAAAMF